MADRRIRILLEQEPDGRWLASISTEDVGVGGVMAYGATRKEAARQVAALALKVLSDLVENGEAPEWISTGLFAELV